MTTLDLELNPQAANERLRRILTAINNLRPLMAGIAGEMLAQTERNFRLEGRPKWPVLAPSTQRARARQGHGAASPILRGRVPNLVRNFKIEFSERHAAIKNDTPYARIHQFGGRAGRGLNITVPARPFLPVQADKKTLTPEMQRGINRLIKDYLTRAARA